MDTIRKSTGIQPAGDVPRLRQATQNSGERKQLTKIPAFPASLIRFSWDSWFPD